MGTSGKKRTLTYRVISEISFQFIIGHKEHPNYTIIHNYVELKLRRIRKIEKQRYPPVPR